jgi:hypothetical protein
MMTEIALFITSILLWIMAVICGMASGKPGQKIEPTDQQFAGFCAVVSVTLALCAYVVTVSA